MILDAACGILLFVPHRQLRISAPAGLWPLTWPMGLTMLRLMLLPVFLWLLLAGADSHQHRLRLAALAVFAVMALTDKLDGYLARKLRQVSKLGTILDPVADKLLVACSVILLSFDSIATPQFRIPLPVVAILYASYLLVAIGTLVLLALVGHVQVSPRPPGKLGTVLQLTLVILTLIGPQFGPGGRESIRKILVVLWWVVPALAAITCADYVHQGIRQFRVARKPAAA